MKKIIILLCMLIIGCGVNAQKLKEADVPASVRTKFASLYPNAKNVEWEKEDGKYEAGIGQNKGEISVLFDVNGNHLQTESEIQVTDLPQGVRDYSSQNLKGKNIDEATKIIDAGGIVTFEIEIGDEDYLFDDSGKFIKKDSQSRDNDEDDDNEENDNNDGNRKNGDNK